MEHLSLATPIIDPTAFIAPGAHIYGDVRVGADAVVMFGVVARAELDRIVIGARTNVQDNAVLHADEDVPCLIGSDVTVGHAAVVHGAEVGDRCLIGIGALVLNRANIGEGAWVAAGSVVTEGSTIPAWTLALGTPARPVRDLTDTEIARHRKGVEEYQRFAAAYRLG